MIIYKVVGIEITMTNSELIDQIKFLADSLGFRTGLHKPRMVHCQTNATPIAYRITIHGDFTDCPIRIARKKPTLETKRVDSQMTGIQIEADEVDDYFGFELDEDGLFLLGDMTVTHNSSYLRFEAYHSAMLGKGVVIFNYDNDPIDYARSLITLRCGLSNEKLKNPKLMSDAEMNMVKNTAHELYSLPIYIESKHGDVDWLKRTARFYAAQKKVGLIVVDYIQQIRNSDKDSRNDDVGRTMSALREINFTLNLPILAASQLNREIERRSGATPMLADLRDSGSLEQDPTVIMFPRTTWTDPTQAEITSFPENVDPRTHRAYPQLKAIPIEFHVKKNRNGPTGVSEVVKWNKSTGQYGTLENNSR